MRNSLAVKPILLRVLGTLALLSAVGCTTLHARPPDEARRASLAVLCNDPDVAHERWCGKSAQR